jgi:N-acyl-D-amino-acid deacylase
MPSLFPGSNSLSLRRASLATAVALVVAAGALLGGTTSQAQPPAARGASTLIVNAVLIDGTGAARRPGAVRLRGGQIAETGHLKPASGETVIDAKGLALSPGFIDTHSHGDRGLFEHRDARAATSQGITTIVAGQDGGSPWPLADFFARLQREPAAVNVASYVGHGRIRREVMGEDFRRAATPDEVARMRALLEGEMKAGALGLSTGLEYDPGIYSARSEVVDLARVAGAAGGRYISHIRSEDRQFWDAIDEILAIGREAKLPVQVSHAKLAMHSLWGQADRLLKTLDEARASGIDVTADVYPYLFWQSTLTVLFPERDFENRQAAEFAVTEVSTPEGLLLGAFAPQPTYAGKTVAEIAKLRGTDAPTTLMDLIREALAYEKKTGSDEVESVIGTSMSEPDLERLLAWPYANICTDGELDGRHPRGYGSFPRVLGRYVRERKLISLEEAIRKMTSLAAHNVGLKGRGEIRPGQAADLVLFDPAKVLDRATTKDPQALSAGIEKVWVNGAVVFENGAATAARPGLVLKR